MATSGTLRSASAYCWSITFPKVPNVDQLRAVTRYRGTNASVDEWVGDTLMLVGSANDAHTFIKDSGTQQMQDILGTDVTVCFQCRKCDVFTPASWNTTKNHPTPNNNNSSKCTHVL